MNSGPLDQQRKMTSTAGPGTNELINGMTGNGDLDKFIAPIESNRSLSPSSPRSHFLRLSRLNRFTEYNH
jgi:hypothetical protein